VNLVPFSSEHLRVNTALPFDIVDQAGVLLMPKGAVLSDSGQLRQLQSHTLMVDEEQTEEWRRGLAGKIDSMVRQNVMLKTIAKASPDQAHPLIRPAEALSLPSEVSVLQMRLSQLLRDTHAEPGWKARVEALALRVQQLTERDADALLYLLVQTSTHHTEHYSSCHAFLCAVVAELCARQLQWSAELRRSLVHAALTMNLAMTSLQNSLALQDQPLSAEQKQRIADHPAQGVQMLRNAGVDDAVWLDVVALHHGGVNAESPLAELSSAQCAARVLQRVDVFTAKISPRKGRVGLPAPLAARDACLGPNGRPDEVGGATIKALGIYPPGSYVKLASGEVAVVMRRGARADRPRVGSIVSREGQVMGVPALRDTTDPRHEVKGAVRTNEIRVRVNHERMLALR